MSGMSRPSFFFFEKKSAKIKIVAHNSGQGKCSHLCGRGQKFLQKNDMDESDKGEEMSLME